MIDKLIGPVTGLLDKFIEDKDQKARLAHDLATMAHQHAQEIAKGQMAINLSESQHKSLFISGWRPALGWVAVLGMFGNYITIPFTNFAMALLKIDIIIPLIPLETMMPIVMGMLGLGGLRTYEKHKGVHRDK